MSGKHTCLVCEQKDYFIVAYLLIIHNHVILQLRHKKPDSPKTYAFIFEVI